MTLLRWNVCALCACLGFCASASGAAGPTKLVGATPGASDSFGNAAAVDGDTMLVGAVNDDPLGSLNDGSVRVFRWGGAGWVAEGELLSAVPGAAGDAFGFSVAIAGDTAVVGAWGDDDGGADAGAAYVFTRTGLVWTQQAKLTASDAAANEYFGASVSIDGDTLIVGSDWDNGQRGAVYVFTRSGSVWTERAKLTAPDGAAGDQLGFSSQISGDTILAGAWGDDDAGASSGAAYVWTGSGASWAFQQKLVASDAAAGDLFGNAVALDGDSAIIGAPFGGGLVVDSGAAYAFVRIAGAWSQVSELHSSDEATGNRFGASVALQGATAVVGEFAGGANEEGAAYVFAFDSTAPIATAGTGLVGDGVSLSLFANSKDSGGAGDLVGGRVHSPSGAPDLFFRAASTPTFPGALDTFVEFAIPFGEIVPGLWDVFPWEGAVHGSDNWMKVIRDGDGAVSWAQFVFDMTDGAGADPILLDIPRFIRRADGADMTLGAAIAGPWSLQARLGAFDGANGHQFGAAVALDAETIVVGAPVATAGTTALAGAAYVFERIGSAWVGPDQQAFAADAGADDRFGSAVAIDGDRAVVGAPQENFQFGAAYVFVRTNGVWRQEAKLTGTGGADVNFFGQSVAIHGDTIVIGAITEDSSGAINSGAAYVFVRSGSNWAPQQKLEASDALQSDRFGASVSISGDTVAVGALLGDAGAVANTGAVYVYTRAGSVWTQRVKLTAIGADAATSDGFGGAVSLRGGTLLIGAAGDQGAAGAGQGAVYVYTGSGAAWTQQVKLAPADAQAGDGFGGSVAQDGSTAIIAASFDGDAGASAGSAYIFTGAGAAWAQQAKLIASNAAAFDRFGASVSVGGDTAVVGAFNGDGPIGANTGSAYVFERFGSLWLERALLAASNGVAGDQYGLAVGISGVTAVVGAPGDDGAAGSDLGSAWFVPLNEERFTPLVLNTDTGARHGSLASAIGAASPGDAMSANPSAFHDAAANAGGLGLTIGADRAIRMASGSSLSLGAGSALFGGIGTGVDIYGLIDLNAGASMSALGEQLRVGPSGSLALGLNTTLDATGTQRVTLQGPTTIAAGGALLGGDAVRNRSTLTMIGASLSSEGATTNDRDLVVQGDSYLFGDYTNNGTTTIQSGVLTILGAVTDNGTIVGDFGGTRAPGGFFVEQDYAAGAGALLAMVGGVAKFGGDADIAITDNARFDMVTSEVRMVGLAGGAQTLEVLSVDVGPSPDGLDRSVAGHLPIGTLRIGPTPTTVNLVDAHLTSGPGARGLLDVLYVHHLQIDAGATLNTNGRTVYYETLANSGSVDDPANLVQIVACSADLTGDGQVDGADLGLLLGSWGGAQGDLTGDGFTDGADLGLLLGAWGACP